MTRNPVFLLSIFLLPLVSGNNDRDLGAEEPPSRVIQFRNTGDWSVTFEPETSNLVCRHSSTGVSLSGRLVFEAEIEGKRRNWRVVPSRDPAPGRLGLLNPRDNVQGYVSFGGTGGMLRMTVVHRPEQVYHGRLIYSGTVVVGTDTFACRTRPIPGSRVFRLASGEADSPLNDSIFDRETDTALVFGGLHARVGKSCNDPGDYSFRFEASAVPQDALNSSIEIEVLQDYLRSRYVPYYHPINKKRLPHAPTGWLSWNSYFDTAGEAGNLREIEVAARYLKPFGLEYWSLESWQENSGVLPVSKFHTQTLKHDPRKFPHGMKWMAEKIREYGFKPGIWTVPFGTGDREFYEAHKDWFLHDPQGKPMSNWSGLYVLDPSQEEVRHHMEENHRIISREWGYEYFKIDGLSAHDHHKSAHFFERPEVRAAFKNDCENPLLLCIQALRRGIGEESIWVGCGGHYTGPEVGYIDTARLGADIVSGCYRNPPPRWNNYLRQARMTLNQYFVHNIIWYCDPDTLMVDDKVPLETARIAATVISLPGQVTFAGDKLAELSMERIRLLQQCLPVCDIHPVDLFPIFEMLPVWDLKVHRPFADWDVVSLFNWEEQPCDIEVSFEELGLAPDRDYLLFDFWNQDLEGICREKFRIPVPGHSNRLLSIHPHLSRPQFLSTDRHLTQGGISLRDLSWNAENRVLTGSIELVGGFPSKMVFYIPNGFEQPVFRADGVHVMGSRRTTEGLFVVEVESRESRAVSWTLSF